MQELIERIRSEGVNLGGGILKVDSLINHQLDPQLMAAMGKAIAKRFAGVQIDRILTAEISGIAPALMTGIEMDIPVVYARKKKPITMAGPVYLETAPSHTKGGETLLLVSAEFLHADENVLIIDDFLASGRTLLALARIVKSAGANLVGVGVVVEKTFEGGRAAVQAQFDIPIHALATITALDGETITLLDTRQPRLELD
ncbi:MAG: xanthine phosphoribosyltransferase [Chloroflexi bacterium]|nr:xanthine phosphoribosyltransferase [Chloroflexota bacterium]